MSDNKRESLWAIEARYNDGTDRATLQILVKAFRGIQKLRPDDPNSFYCISGFHGMPFRGPGVTDDKKWWGGYCHHGDVLFPMWHRAYVLRIENALRSVDGCKNVRIPYWDELVGYGGPTELPIPAPSPQTIPTILTSPQFEGEPNPLYSYTLQEGFKYQVKGENERYSKPAGYETSRYPLSGLVGTEEDRKNTAIHNAIFANQAENVEILNGNVANWLTGNVDIPDDGSGTTKPPDVTAVYERLMKCLKAPNYTVFSNLASSDDHNEKYGPNPLVVPLESPHNAIHLAVGGFYQRGKYNASPIRGANGEMGSNEVASFDPIFFFHHAFIDYVFWKWQEIHHCTATGSINIDDRYKGTTTPKGLPVPEGAPERPEGSPLTMDSALYPFLKDQKTYFTSNDLVDIRTQLGYDYGPGSLDAVLRGQEYGIPSHQVPIVQKISGIDSRDYWGSFVVRLYCYTASGAKVEVGREAVLSRLKLSDCPNCQNHVEKVFFIPLHEDVIPLLQKDRDGKYRTSVGIHTYDREYFPEEETGRGNVPVVTPL